MTAWPNTLSAGYNQRSDQHQLCSRGGLRKTAGHARQQHMLLQ
jgi:hypothetical protein